MSDNDTVLLIIYIASGVFMLGAGLLIGWLQWGKRWEDDIDREWQRAHEAMKRQAW